MTIGRREHWCAQTGFGTRLRAPASQLAINFPHDLFSTTYPLVRLLLPHILQPIVQILDLSRHIIDLALIRALNLARLANRQVQRELHARVHPTAEPRAALLHVLRHHA